MACEWPLTNDVTPPIRKARPVLQPGVRHPHFQNLQPAASAVIGWPAGMEKRDAWLRGLRPRNRPAVMVMPERECGKPGKWLGPGQQLMRLSSENGSPAERIALGYSSRPQPNSKPNTRVVAENDAGERSFGIDHVFSSANPAKA